MESNETVESNGVKEALDLFLDKANVEPLGAVLSLPWNGLSKKTQKRYTKKASPIAADAFLI